MDNADTDSDTGADSVFGYDRRSVLTMTGTVGALTLLPGITVASGKSDATTDTTMQDITHDTDGIDEEAPTDDDAFVDTDAVLVAIDDWRDDEITTDTLLYVIDVWRNEYSIADVINDWRDDEISTDTLLYMIDIYRG